MACKALSGLWHSRHSAMLAAPAIAHGKIASVRFRPIADSPTRTQADPMKITRTTLAAVNGVLIGAGFGGLVAWERWREGLGFHAYLILAGAAAGFIAVRLAGLGRGP
jgi:hypothetical protein